jgi:hypothetical protein
LFLNDATVGALHESIASRLRHPTIRLSVEQHALGALQLGSADAVIVLMFGSMALVLSAGGWAQGCDRACLSPSG